MIVNTRDYGPVVFPECEVNNGSVTSITEWSNLAEIMGISLPASGEYELVLANGNSIIFRIGSNESIRFIKAGTEVTSISWSTYGWRTTPYKPYLIGFTRVPLISWFNFPIEGITTGYPYLNSMYRASNRDVPVVSNIVSSRTAQEDLAGFFGDPPPTYNFKPISYLRSPKNHLKLSMIREEYTNGGEEVTRVDPDVNIQRIAQESNIGILAKNTVIGGRKVVGWTANNKYVAIHRLPNNPEYPALIAFDIEHYIDGQIVSGLTTSITGFPVGDTMNLYFSYIIDEENEAARLSIIRIDHVGELYTAYYNQESVNFEQYSDYYNWLSGGYMFGEPENPYDWGEDSQPSDGDGSHDTTSDKIGESEIPGFAVSDAGFVTLFTPTLNQIRSLSSYMWGTLDTTNWKRLFANPMDCVINLSLLPFDITKEADVKEIKIGNIGTGVTSYVAASQWKEIDMGSIDMNEFYAGYLDYSPYTKIQLFLPYIGTVELNPDDVMAAVIRLKYKIDILSGACVATVYVGRPTDSQHVGVDAPLYTFTGNCAVTVPISSGSYQTFFRSLMGTIGSAGMVLATGGGTAAPVMMARAVAGASSVASNVLSSKPDVARSGKISSTAGFLNHQRAFLIITRPNQCKVNSQEKFVGFPTHISYTLSELSGYTEIEKIHLEGMTCTDSELEEIEKLLLEGVII